MSEALSPVNTGPLAGLNIVLVTPNLKARNVLLQAIAVVSSVVPNMKSDSESAQRAHFAPAVSKVIINTAASRMQEVLGFHCAVIAIEVDDRVASAHKAKEVFEKHGFSAKVHTHAEPEFPDGFLTFVSVPALAGIALMFWPNKPPAPEVIATLPKRLPWTEEDMAVTM